MKRARGEPSPLLFGSVEDPKPVIQATFCTLQPPPFVHIALKVTFAGQLSCLDVSTGGQADAKASNWSDIEPLLIGLGARRRSKVFVTRCHV